MCIRDRDDIACLNEDRSSAVRLVASSMNFSNCVRYCAIFSEKMCFKSELQNSVIMKAASV